MSRFSGLIHLQEKGKNFTGTLMQRHGSYSMGEALVDTQDEQVRAYSGDIVTVSSRTIHRYRAGGEVNLRMICIHPSPKVVEEFI